MMSITIYRFVVANLTAMRISSEVTSADASYTGFINLLTTQWQELPSGVGAIQGEPFKFNDRPQDQITWICGSGPGLLTRYGGGEFLVTMRLRPAGGKADQMELGFMRRPRETAEGSDEGETWVSLLDDVRGLQIRYFNPQLNAWVDKWNPGPGPMPRLIKLAIDRPGRSVPMEAIIALGRTPHPY
jgi:hypothetical protein